MRGEQQRYLVPCPAVPGITPACAGSSTRERSAGPWEWDHPRMRGEQLIGRPPLGSCLGSPPHARGAVRAIPFHAGTFGDHPRMRGEQGFGTLPAGRLQGSPPHARGAAPRKALPGARRGITPACAGSRSRNAGSSGAPWDHPRMRGEQRRCGDAGSRTIGSPPHARGAATTAGTQYWQQGITPACAGSSTRRRPAWRSCRDHPRMRGEQVLIPRGILKGKGSPPHARGADQVLQPHLFWSGITPACAGSSPPPCQGLPLRRDHPRMRGEQRTISHIFSTW